MLAITLFLASSAFIENLKPYNMKALGSSFSSKRAGIG
jgi:hypothetical protein